MPIGRIGTQTAPQFSTSNESTPETDESSATVPASEPIVEPVVSADVSTIVPRKKPVPSKFAVLAMNALADTHEVKTSHKFGAQKLIRGTLKVGEQIALPGTPSHQALVESDRFRRDYEKANPHTVWAKTTAVTGVSANFPIGMGPSVGFNGNVEVTAVVSHQVDELKDLPGAVAKQAKSMVIPLDTRSLAELKPAAGSEWMFRGEASVPLGVGMGIGQSVSLGVADVTAVAGIGLSVGANAIITKNIKVLEDNKVFVQIGATKAASIGVGAEAKLQAKDFLGLLKVSAAASAGASAAVEHRILGAAVLDLNTTAGRASFDYIMQASPGNAAEHITEQRLGAEYNGIGKSRAVAANIRFGNMKILSASIGKGSSTGTLTQKDSTTSLGQSDYSKNIEGWLFRLLKTEERSVNVRAGSATRDGQEERVVALSLHVKDSKFTSGELSQLARLGRAMDNPLQGLPPSVTKGDLGPGTYHIDLALSESQLDKLGAWDRDSIRLAFAIAQTELEGGEEKLPTWFEQPELFAAFKEKHLSPVGPSGRAFPTVQSSIHGEAALEYAERFPGRDLAKDIASEEAVSAIQKYIEKAKGAPVAEWGKVLEAVGKQSNIDLRATMLAFRRLAGASVVNFSVTAQGQTVSANPEAPLPPSLNEYVGSVVSAPA